MLPKEIIDNLSEKSGVYYFKNIKSEIIYVGKAKNLRSRLSSYFQKNLPEKTKQMVWTASSVDWTIVKNEIEALQLEFTWIRSESPRFNVIFRDDKSYPYLAVSSKDKYPRLFITRKEKLIWTGKTYLKTRFRKNFHVIF